jgi:uncharacterized membrane protein YhaH (DUF805 family)
VCRVPKLLFSYEGGISAKQFWLGLLSCLASTVLLTVGVSLVLGVALVLTGASPRTVEYAVWGSTALIVGYAIFTQLAVTVKRCHARGRSGWWCLLTLIPFVGLAWLVLDLGLPHADAAGTKDKPNAV